MWPIRLGWKVAERRRVKIIVNESAALSAGRVIRNLSNGLHCCKFQRGKICVRCERILPNKKTEKESNKMQRERRRGLNCCWCFFFFFLFFEYKIIILATFIQNGVCRFPLENGV